MRKGNGTKKRIRREGDEEMRRIAKMDREGDDHPLPFSPTPAFSTVK